MNLHETRYDGNRKDCRGTDSTQSYESNMPWSIPTSSLPCPFYFRPLVLKETDNYMCLFKLIRENCCPCRVDEQRSIQQRCCCVQKQANSGARTRTTSECMQQKSFYFLIFIGANVRVCGCQFGYPFLVTSILIPRYKNILHFLCLCTDVSGRH